MLFVYIIALFLLGALMLWLGQKENHHILTLIALLLWLIMGVFMFTNQAAGGDVSITIPTGSYTTYTNYSYSNATTINSTVEVKIPEQVAFPSLLYTILEGMFVFGSLGLAIYIFFL